MLITLVASRMGNMDSEEKLVLEHIKDSKNMGASVPAASPSPM
jgi:hypothetical protein